ncbi:multicopper oxidase family protein [Streptomyces sp. NPDC085612]|uniref:multicopper oxidase family protein n=1 Tax=Streptomyces sp. NPDC085612 TaxID=3365732 RepID=UPI0037D283E4
MSDRRSSLSRRRLLGVTGAAVAAAALGGTAGCARLTGETTGKELSSRARLPEPFTVPLPVPQAAEAVSREGGVDLYAVEQREAAVEILPGLKTRVWGYDGVFPGRTIVGRSGRRTVLKVTNSLPVPTSTHLHGGVTPPDSDGYPTDLLLPRGEAGRKDWTKSMASHGAGHAAHGAAPGRAPEGWRFTEGEREYTYPLDQPAATLWYHDHRMDFSAPQVWRGLAGFFLVKDEAEEALPLPAGERDVPLMLCDRAFEEDGSFRYPALDPTLTEKAGVEEAYGSGVLGDVQLVNGAPWPVLEVEGARYRLRFLNAANARRYRLRLTSDGDGPKGAPFVQVGSDCGLLERPVSHEELTLAPAERLDVVVDFSGFRDGSLVTVVNTLGSGAMRKVMAFRVRRSTRADGSQVPSRLVASPRVTRGEAVADRQFDFRSTQHGEGHMWTINGRPFSVGETWASPRLDTVELWRFTSDFHHPVHLHLAQFRVVARSGRAPLATDAGWKDTVDVRPYEVVEVLVRFHGYKGRYMMHCHNLEHEDMAMMANFDVV